jgi:hypothetical protein
LLATCFSLDLYLYPEDGAEIFIRNIGCLSTDYTGLYPRRRNLKIMKDVYRLCGLVVRVLGYRSGGPGSIPSTTRKKVVGLERSPFSLVSTTEELLDRKVAAPV